MVREEKINSKRCAIMSGYRPNKLFRLAIVNYLKKVKEEEENLDEINIEK